jgi:hypothetical protein
VPDGSLELVLIVGPAFVALVVAAYVWIRRRK